MNSHLLVKYDGQPLVLNNSTSIDIEDSNPVFNDVEMYSYPVAVPMHGNRHVIGNIDDSNSGSRAIALEHKKMDIIVDGIPLRSGLAIVQEDEVIEDALSMNVDAALQSFDDLIGDLKCRDVPLKDKILIGEKVGNIRVDVSYDAEIVVGFKHGGQIDSGRITGNKASVTFDPQALGFSYPGKCEVKGPHQEAVVKTVRTYPEDRNGEHKVNVPLKYGDTMESKDTMPTYINVSDPYPLMPYCNARVCYQHKGLNDDGSTSDAVADPATCKGMYEDHYPYWVLGADRPQSGICFYIRYFLDCLFEHIGVSFDATALDAVPDLSRLAFFTTKCAFTTETLYADVFSTKEQINNWLSSRGCGGTIDVEEPEQRDLDYFTYIKSDGTEQTFVTDEEIQVPWPWIEKDVVNWIKSEPHNSDPSWFSYTIKGDVQQMFATNENFPDETVKTVLDSLEASFGIRFHYDAQLRKVTAYLMRDVFRSQAAPIHLDADVLSIRPMTEKITGVRMKYSAEGDQDEQQRNVRTGKRDYDTEYDYIDYPEDRTITSKTYKDIFLNVSGGDMSVYVDMQTGNAYRVKVDADATTAEELRPVLFEVGQFKGVEYGDCSDVNEDYVREYVSDFQPVSFNDVNYQNERRAVPVSGSGEVDGKTIDYGVGTVSASPILCAYADEDMEHEFVESRIKTAITPALYDIYVSQVLQLVESYDPSQSDDGNSPLQEYDWGLAIAMMRGGGTDMTVQQYDAGYDGFGNDKWRTVAGDYAMASDTMDQFGNVFDYNGDAPGIGDEERFSLKIRAYKQPSWAESPLCVADPTVRMRGLFDTFMSELAYFLVNRQKYRITAHVELSQLADIPNHWDRKFEIGGKIGFIDRLRYSVDAVEGIGEVEIDFFAL